MQKAIIIGSGIAGTTLALQLKRIGIPCTIYESEEKFSSIGLFIYISPNGMNIFRSLGIYEKIMNLGIVPSKWLSEDVSLLVIKGEDTFIVGYVLFDKKPGYAETNTVEEARAYLLEKIEDGELELPSGISFSFTGNYENQVRADNKLKVILPLALLIIFIIPLFSQR